jgi:hypothetical protein
MNRWTLRQAARLGYRIGRGHSIDDIRIDPVFRPLRKVLARAASTWRLSEPIPSSSDNAIPSKQDTDALLAIRLQPEDLTT